MRNLTLRRDIGSENRRLPQYLRAIDGGPPLLL